MRSLVASRSRLLARVAVLAVAAAAMAGCSADISRFADNSLLNPIAPKPAAGDMTAAAPSGRVDAQALPAPSQPTNIAGTGAANMASALKARSVLLIMPISIRIVRAPPDRIILLWLRR